MQSCEEFRLWLEAYADNELARGDRRKVEEHIGSCLRCRLIVDETRTLHARLQTDAKSGEPDAAYFDGLLARAQARFDFDSAERAWTRPATGRRVRTESPARPLTGRTPWWLRAGLGAATIAAVALIIFLVNEPPLEPEPTAGTPSGLRDGGSPATLSGEKGGPGTRQVESIPSGSRSLELDAAEGPESPGASGPAAPAPAATGLAAGPSSEPAAGPGTGEAAGQPRTGQLATGTSEESGPGGGVAVAPSSAVPPGTAPADRPAAALPEPDLAEGPAAGPPASVETLAPGPEEHGELLGLAPSPPEAGPRSAPSATPTSEGVGESPAQAAGLLAAGAAPDRDTLVSWCQKLAALLPAEAPAGVRGGFAQYREKSTVTIPPGGAAFDRAVPPGTGRSAATGANLGQEDLFERERDPTLSDTMWVRAWRAEARRLADLALQDPAPERCRIALTAYWHLEHRAGRGIHEDPGTRARAFGPDRARLERLLDCVQP